MTATTFTIKHDIQKEVIDLLERDTVKFEAMVGFVKMNDGINPMVIVAENIPNKDAFQKELFNLFDKYFDLRKIQEDSRRPATSKP